MSMLHYSGHGGQSTLNITGVVWAILTHPESPHHVWRPGWPEWRSWSDDPQVAAAVRAADSPGGALSRYRETLAEMLADGVLEPWEDHELQRLRDELGIPRALHDRLWAAAGPTAVLPLLELDARSLQGFRAGQRCMLRFRVRNTTERALRSCRLHIHTSAGEPELSQSGRIPPARTDELLVGFLPERAGQHRLSGQLTIEPYSGSATRASLHPMAFTVAAAESAGPQIFNIDARSMRVGKFELGEAEVRTGPADWVRVPLTPINDQLADAQTAVVAEATPDTLNYQGPSGRQTLTVAEAIARIRADPDAAHHVWAPGWARWRPWRDVPSLAEGVARRPVCWFHLETHAAEVEDAPSGLLITCTEPIHVGEIALDELSGLLDGAAVWQGATTNRTTLAALIAARQWELLARALDARRRHPESWTPQDAALAAVAADPEDASALRGLPLGLHAALLHLVTGADAAGALMLTHLSGEIDPLERARAWRWLANDTPRAAAQIEALGDERLGERALALARILGEPDEARRLLRGASGSTRRELALQARAWKLGLDDTCAALRVLSRAAALPCRSSDEGVFEAAAWMALLGDRAAAAAALNAAEEAAHKPSHQGIVTSGLAHLLAEDRRTLRALQRWSDRDTSLRGRAAQAEVWRSHLDDADQARAVLRELPSGNTAGWLTAAAVWARLEGPVGTARCLNQAQSTAHRPADRIAVALAWERLAGDAEAGRGSLEITGIELSCSDLVAIAEAHGALGSAESARLGLLAKAERVARKPNDFADLSRAWAALGDDAEATRCLEAGGTKARERGTDAVWKKLACSWAGLGEMSRAERCLAAAEGAREQPARRPAGRRGRGRRSAPSALRDRMLALPRGHRVALLHNAVVSLEWSGGAGLDLGLFYTGGAASGMLLPSRYPGAEMGELMRFPYVRLSVEDTHTQHIRVARITRFSEVERLTIAVLAAEPPTPKAKVQIVSADGRCYSIAVPTLTEPEEAIVIGQFVVIPGRGMRQAAGLWVGGEDTPEPLARVDLAAMRSLVPGAETLQPPQVGGGAHAIRLVSFPPTAKLPLIRVIRETLEGLSFADAASLLDQTPTCLRRDLDQDGAERFAAALRDLGAEVEIRSPSHERAER